MPFPRWLLATVFSVRADLSGTLQGGPRTDAMIAAAVQWAEGIMRKIDAVTSSEVAPLAGCVD